MIEQSMRILERLLTVPKGEREAILASECGGDATLKRFVRQLIDHADSNATWLHEPAIVASAATTKRTTPWTCTTVVDDG